MLSRFYKPLVLWIALTLELSINSVLYAQPDWYQLDSATFRGRFPNARLLDRGKLNLYSYRDYEGSFHATGDSEKLLLAAGGLLLELLDSPADYYVVQFDGQCVEVKTEKGFKEKTKEWFADDPLLLRYIHNNKIKLRYMPYLVRMYNGHAPRPFDPDFESVPIQFVADGFADERDGRVYDIIKVNNLTWLAENLQYCPWPSCTGVAPNGVYYHWNSAKQVCPPDWRLPDETDWKTLFLGFGLPLERIDKISGFDKDGVLGKKLVKDSTILTGFNAIRQVELNGSAYFWTAEEFSASKAVAIEIGPSNKVGYAYFKKTGGVNVRCVK